MADLEQTAGQDPSTSPPDKDIQGQAGQDPQKQEPEINKFFRAAIKTGASDVHLKVGQPAKLRVFGELKNTTGEILTQKRLEGLSFEILTDEQKQTFLKMGTLDFAYGVTDEERFRINLFRQRGLISMTARRVNADIPSLDTLNLPATLKKIADGSQGLVLLVGPTGCGKTTTAVAMVDYVNSNHSCHIVTVEDPIEYLIKDKKAIVSQREIGIDVPNYDEALMYLMREDPDVVFMGEVRDAKTVAASMRAAETGHLVFGTIHAANASQTVQRVVDLFPQVERDLARQTLALTLRAIISQVLLPSIKEGIGRVPAVEILLANPEARKLISESREAELTNLIRGCAGEGMQDLIDSLVKLVLDGFVEPKEAYKLAPNAEELKMALKGIRAEKGGIL
ncbi:MAG: PilT/PilU family type 4a pilus ATPase [Sedimentisphaerales bacterium]|nr:PilT/PilU family type 4a pilus ATPase [Sedimentisphaerales bacterium]